MRKGDDMDMNWQTMLHEAANASFEFDGSASGNIMGVTTKRGTNTATLSGFMIDAKGVSFTAPDVSSSLTY